MMLRCLICGDHSAECGRFVETPSGSIRHIGPCCLALAQRINDPYEEATFKYALAT